MRTFCLTTLGCKVNQYESEQIAALLRGRGLRQVDRPEHADLRIVNTCSVTVQAASKSRQSVRQMTRLPVLDQPVAPDLDPLGPVLNPQQKTIVIGCWATSDPAHARSLPGVTTVIGHHANVAAQLDQLLSGVKENAEVGMLNDEFDSHSSFITHHSSFPSPSRQATHQRAILKIQDGCDAHCTYCIIPKLRPNLWSKPLDDVIAEATRLTEAGHKEIVLTGIFLSAYGQQTALRRRQPTSAGRPLADIVHSLCTRVPGLHRLRLSSLEPGDLNDFLIDALASHPQAVPHFHLPLQSGSDLILRRMNRQYTRADYLRMIDRLRQTFDRPAITTDIIVGFPGESAAEFEQTLDVVRQAGFIHIHAFPFSPRPGTAAARWKGDFIHGPIVNQRIDQLRDIAAGQSLDFRRQFLGQTVELLVERPAPSSAAGGKGPELQHGRCPRYFTVHFAHSESLVGRSVNVRIDRVSEDRTTGIVVSC
jgi:threonylcarbamoyladenosine tRNA methylthiotransferase MtaB